MQEPKGPMKNYSFHPVNNGSICYNPKEPSMLLQSRAICKIQLFTIIFKLSHMKYFDFCNIWKLKNLRLSYSILIIWLKTLSGISRTVLDVRPLLSIPFIPPLMARFIRLHPRTYVGSPSLRFELIGYGPLADYIGKHLFLSLLILLLSYPFTVANLGITAPGASNEIKPPPKIIYITIQENKARAKNTFNVV